MKGPRLKFGPFTYLYINNNVDRLFVKLALADLEC